MIRIRWECESILHIAGLEAWLVVAIVVILAALVGMLLG